MNEWSGQTNSGGEAPAEPPNALSPERLRGSLTLPSKGLGTTQLSFGVVGLPQTGLLPIQVTAHVV